MSKKKEVVCNYETSLHEVRRAFHSADCHKIIDVDVKSVYIHISFI